VLQLALHLPEVHDDVASARPPQQTLEGGHLPRVHDSRHKTTREGISSSSSSSSSSTTTSTSGDSFLFSNL